VMRFPLVLPRTEIRRLLRGATALVVPRHLAVGTYPVHDLATAIRNRGRPMHERDEAYRATIEVSHVEQMRLIELDFAIVRRAGERTQRDFYADWLTRRGMINPTELVSVATVALASSPRMLHRDVHKGYTDKPGLAAFGEPEALSAEELERISRQAREHDDQRRRQQQATKSLPRRVQELELRANTGDDQARRHLFMVAKHLEDAEARGSRTVA
jgi:hypothetical protein